MRLLGLNHGQYGDLILSLPTVRALKKSNPSIHYTACVNKKYRDIVPVLLWSGDIDGVHLTSGYDNWQNPDDIEAMRRGRYDGIFNPMQPHQQDDWWKYRHQTQEVAHMHHLDIKVDTQIELTCPYTIRPVRSVAISPIGGGGAAHKTVQGTQYQHLVDCLRDNLGYELIYQLTPYGWKGEVPHGVTVTNSTYEQSVLIALASDFYIGTDTGMTWVMSAFKKPTLAMYSNGYYGDEFVRNIQPTNPNAHYLSAPNLNDIPFKNIEDFVYYLAHASHTDSKKP